MRYTVTRRPLSGPSAAVPAATTGRRLLLTTWRIEPTIRTLDSSTRNIRLRCAPTPVRRAHMPEGERQNSGSQYFSSGWWLRVEGARLVDHRVISSRRMSRHRTHMPGRKLQGPSRHDPGCPSPIVPTTTHRSTPLATPESALNAIDWISWSSSPVCCCGLPLVTFLFSFSSPSRGGPELVSSGAPPSSQRERIPPAGCHRSRHTETISRGSAPTW